MFKILDVIWMIITTWLELPVQLIFSDTRTGEWLKSQLNLIRQEYGLIIFSQIYEVRMIYACDRYCDVLERHSWRLPVDLVALAHLDCLWDTCVNSSKKNPEWECCTTLPVDLDHVTWLQWRLAHLERRNLVKLVSALQRKIKNLGKVFIWKFCLLFEERSRAKLGLVFAWMESCGWQVAVIQLEKKLIKLLCQFFKEWLELLPLNLYLSLRPLLVNLETINIKFCYKLELELMEKN